MTRNKKLIIVYAAIFILVESAAVFYAVYSAKALAAEQFRPIQVIRIGILPDVSQKYSRKFWRSFVNLFKDESDGFIVEPYFAHSYDELLDGFVNGSLDIIYVNPATFYDLAKDHDLISIACQRLSELDIDKNRSVLVTNKEIDFINQTKGLRLTFVDHFSLTGYIVPYNSLVRSLSPIKVSDWFSEISFAPTKSQAFNNMINGETDIVATDKLALMRIVNYLQYSDVGLKELWVSRTMPESLLCCFKKFDDDNKEKMKIIRKIILKDSEAKNYVDQKQISFELTKYNYTYEEKLTSLQKYIDNLKFSKKRSNVLMKIGGE